MVSARNPCVDPVMAPGAVKILEHIGEAYVAVDANWCFTFINSLAEHIYGTPREFVIGRNLWQMFPSALGTSFEREYRRAMAERTEGSVDAAFPRLGAWFGVRIHPLDNGGLAFYFRDITRMRCAEHQLACQSRVQELIFSGAALDDILSVLSGAMERIAVNPMTVCIQSAEVAGIYLSPGPASSAATLALADENENPERTGNSYLERAVSIEDVAAHAHPAVRTLASHGVRACWSLPLLSPHDAVVGAFTLCLKECVRPLPVEEESAAVLANSAALIVTHRRMHGTRPYTQEALDADAELLRA